MFFENQPIAQRNEYIELLEIVGSLSNLYADSSKPFLHYRATENLFCMCFRAENLSRYDCTADASKNHLGIGIKTFLSTTGGNSMQKIAEFNKRRNEYATLTDESLVYAVSDFRNERINFTKRTHALNEMIYHYTVRDEGKISILECNMDLIDMDSIRIGKKNANTIYFDDGINEYGFNLSKSTLYKRFDTTDVLADIPVSIIEHPYLILRELRGKQSLITASIPDKPYVYLPLYSLKSGQVEKQSGLNQWNAKARYQRKQDKYYDRNPDELYIPVPPMIHKEHPGFFPDNKDEIFNLELPNGEVLSAKMCQEGLKGLMSNPNKALGHWVLRDVLQVPEGELVTNDTLHKVGIDSVVVYKEGDKHYSIDFAQEGSFEAWRANTNMEDDDEDS